MHSVMQCSWPLPITLQVHKIQEIQKLQDSWHVLLVEGQLEVKTVTFSLTLHKNGCLSGWWVRIWIWAGWEPSCAEECLDLSQNIIHLSREQSLPADSLVLWKSEKVPPEVWFYWCTFFCCPNEMQPTCCRSFLFTMQRSLLTFSISLVSFVINALLGRHAQGATLLRWNVY